MMKNKSEIKGKVILAFSLLIFSLMLITSTFAAQDFIIENKTSALFAVNGTTGNIFMVPSFGKVGIGTVSPGLSLTVIGNASISGNLSVGGNVSVDGSTFFVDSTSNNVGIGTTLPNDALEVVGNVRISGSLNASFINASQIRQNGNLVQTVESAYNIANNATNTTSISRILDANLLQKVADFNLQNISNNTLVKGDNLTLALWNISSSQTSLRNAERNLSVNGNNLFVDTTSGNVGIGTTSPAQKLEVSGALKLSGDLYMANNQYIHLRNVAEAGSTAYSLKYDSTSDSVQLGGYTQAYSGTAASRGVALGGFGYNDATFTTSIFTTPYYGDVGLGGNIVTTGTATDGPSLTGAKMVIRGSTGNVGIGTTSPNAKLELNVTSNIAGITTNGTINAPVLNTTSNNLTISSAAGSVIIRLG